MEARQTCLTDNITYIEPPKTERYSCAGLLINSNPSIFIDINLGLKKTKDLIRTAKPDIAIISHYHSDHSNWGPAILELTQAELYVPAGEELYLKSLEHFIQKTAGPYGLIQEWRDFTLNMMGYQEMDGFYSYGDSQIFRTGNVLIECIRTPGHSPSHTCFYFPRQKILFACDIGLGSPGPWYGWNECDICHYVESILMLRSLKTEIIISSHHGIFNNDIELIWNRCLNIILNRERIIRKGLDKGKSKQEIIEHGIYLRGSSHTGEPMRSFGKMWDSIIFDHHERILKKGSLIDLFPELACIKST